MLTANRQTPNNQSALRCGSAFGLWKTFNKHRRFTHVQKLSLSTESSSIQIHVHISADSSCTSQTELGLALHMLSG